MTHTKGPWEIGRIDTVVTAENERTICSTGGYAGNCNSTWVEENPANAKRIVDCVNALEGYNPIAVKDVIDAAYLAYEILTCEEVEHFAKRVARLRGYTPDTRKIKKALDKLEAGND